MTIPLLFGISLLGSILELDLTYLAQVMVARPIIAAPLLGWILGDCETGIRIGLITELVWVNILPIGTKLLPDVFIISYLATAWAIFSGTNQNCILSLALAIPCGMLFRIIEIKIRSWSKIMVSLTEMYIQQGRFMMIDGIMYGSLLFSALRTLIFLLIFIPLGNFIIIQIEMKYPLSVLPNNQLVCIALLVVGLAITAGIFHQMMTQILRDITIKPDPRSEK